MTNIKAIETAYAGCRFRSRLEARWAVFFDTMGIAWRYEAEGYDLNGLWYLPDFWLPDHEVFVEIKPEWPNFREVDMARRLQDVTEKQVMVLAGEPWPGKHVAIQGWAWRSEVYGDELILEGVSCQLCRCRKCSGLCYLEEGNGIWGWGDIGKHTCGDHDKTPSPFTEDDFSAARAARFDSLVKQ